jgi:hypothetical protein
MSFPFHITVAAALSRSTRPLAGFDGRQHDLERVAVRRQENLAACRIELDGDPLLPVLNLAARRDAHGNALRREPVCPDLQLVH